MDTPELNDNKIIIIKKENNHLSIALIEYDDRLEGTYKHWTVMKMYTNRYHESREIVE
jgi:hypothetical protein